MPQWIEHKEVFSLMFERAHGWNGLLVEPHPFSFAKVNIEVIIEEFYIILSW